MICVLSCFAILLGIKLPVCMLDRERKFSFVVVLVRNLVHNEKRSLVGLILFDSRGPRVTKWLNTFMFVCLFDLILYVPTTIFQLNRDGSSWVEPVVS